MQALHLHAGPRAMAHVQQHGLLPQHVGVVPGAAGGPKGLLLGPLDRFLFAHWLPQSPTPVHLVAASIGAWRFATACLTPTEAALQRFEHAYIHQHYEPEPGRRRPSADAVSAAFAQGLRAFYDGCVPEVLAHPKYRLHVLTSRGRHLLHREHPWRTPLGYAGAYLSNAVSRRALGAWLQRTVFSSQGEPPFEVSDLSTACVPLNEGNFFPAVQASCSIPFVLRAVHDIPGAPTGAHWDGGITDYHLHLNYRPPAASPIVLYPHFQQAVVPGWLDKALKWRHAATPFLDDVLVLAPNPEWVRQALPNGKLPDRSDFVHYAHDPAERIRVWTQAVSAAQQLADEWAQWLARPDPTRLQPL